MNRLAGNPQLLRDINATTLLCYIRECGPVSRPALARISGLSLPTVNARVQKLLEARYVREAGRTESHGGRPATLLEFNAEFGYVVGVDVGGGQVSVALANLTGDFLAFEQYPLAEYTDGESVLEATWKTVEELLAAHGMGLDKIMAVGLSTPGLVDPASSEVSCVPNIPGWSELQPARRLEDLTGKPVVIENNVNAAMQGERWKGSAQGVRNAVFVTLDRGVGAGVLVDGRLYRGHRGAAGEIGYLRDFYDDESLDGLFGPFERQASGLAIIRRYCESANVQDKEVTVEDVFSAAVSDDEIARRVVEESTSLIGGGLVNLCAVLAPELVILGGKAASAGRALVDPLHQRLRRALPIPVRLCISELGDQAPVLGVIRLALEVVNEKEFTFGS